MTARPPPGVVRIIAGSLRGSKLPVADRPGLRPTSDRVRETLFNWLQAEVAGTSALDLFAGTGALGFEAASRGAASVRLVERDPALADGLRASASRLKVPQVQVDTGDALGWLARTPDRRYDLVFLDPPFTGGLHQPALDALSPWLAEQAWVYVEAPVGLALSVPRGWLAHRAGHTRDVAYTLYRAGCGQAPDSAGTLGN